MSEARPPLNGDDLLRQLEASVSPDGRDLLRSTAAASTTSGYALYLVGGAVRDLLLRRGNLDLDLVVEGNAIEVAQRVGAEPSTSVLLHDRFGTAKVRRGSASVDLAGARIEDYAHPGALPTVRPGSIHDDLVRRDFTINAIALRLTPPQAGEIVDPAGGRRDLAAGLVRVLHPASFIDDATRMLRALRYEQRLGFRLETATEALLLRDVAMLDTLSRDRVRHELELGMSEQQPELFLMRATQFGILRQIDPRLQADDWLVERLQTARLPKGSSPIGLPISFSLLLYRFNPREANEFIRRYNVPGAVAGVVRHALRLKERLAELGPGTPSRSALLRLLNGYDPQAISACAIATAGEPASGLLRLFLNELRYVRPRLTGADLLRLGVPQGEPLGRLLRALLEAKVDNRTRTRQDEERLVQEWLEQS